MREIVINKPFNEKLKYKFEKVKTDFLNNREMNKNVSKLLKQKNYEDIYTLYGQDVYVAAVPKKYLKSDIKKLLKEGRFEDIYLKYGSTYYNKYLSKMESIDKYLETGKKHHFNKSLFNKLKKKTLSVFTSGVLLLESAPAILLTYVADTGISESAEKYSEDIIKYNSKIKEYSEEIRKLNLNDLETIMKVMDDMWNSIEGYGNPEKNVFGFGRLDFLEDGGIGVCRNLADDFTAKMNAINPDYNARNLIVTLDLSEDSNFQMANIERNIVSSNSSASSSSDASESKITEFLSSNPNILGNHMVTLIDIPLENITLMIDATNPSIGIFVNGSIYSFSTTNGSGWTAPKLRQYMSGSDAEFKQNISMVKSYFQDNKNLEDVISKWGPNAQNDALEKVREISHKSNISINFNNSYQNIYSYDDTKDIESRTK